jgi:hypothetical protein
MSAFDGVPDFGAPLAPGQGAAANVRAFRAWGSGAVVLVMPDALNVAVLPNGMPDFRLSLNRPAPAGTADPAWGSLQFRVEQHCPVQDAMTLARQALEGATVSAACPSGGFARLVAAGNGVALPAELLVPRAIDWSSLSATRFILPRLALTTVSLLKGALVGGTLLVSARLEIEVPGVSPRLPLQVSLQPRKVLGALLAPPPASRRMAWDDLVAALARSYANLPISFAGGAGPDPASAPVFGEVLADRMRMAFGHLVASPAGDAPTIEFDDEARLPDQIQWDLTQAAPALRPWALSLDPLEAPRAWAAAGHLDDLVQETTSTALPVGLWDVAVYANLPPRREGVIAVGTTLRAPARPPLRLQDVVKSVDLQAPDDQGDIRLELAPTETLNYLCAPYVVLTTSGGVSRLDAAESPHDGGVLELSPGDFPASFVAVSAHPALLALASVQGHLDYKAADGLAVQVPFTLSTASPSTSVPLPRAATEPGLSIVANPAGGGTPLALGPLPAGALGLGLWSFPQYGPQHATVSVQFPDSDGALAVDLLPEGATEGADAMTSWLFTPQAPTREYRWFAGSPFHPGFRYRRNLTGGAVDAWSDVQSPSQTLLLVADPKSQGGSMQPTDIDGVRVYPDPNLPATLRYLPPAPIPARDPNGHPLVSLIALGASGSILQLSVRYELEDAVRDQLRTDLSAKAFTLTATNFQPAPVSVDQVRVLLAKPDAGAPADVLATSAGSGYPPWDAIFSIRLNADQVALTKRALAGERSLLSVSVHATVPASVAPSLDGAPGEIERSADVATWFGP